jgi:phage-related protein
LSGESLGKQIEGIVPGIGKITNAYNNVSSITETYKNVVGGNITAVTQISSAISTFSNSVATKIGSVARSIGRKFGF